MSHSPDATSDEQRCAMNTDRELYREKLKDVDDYYADSIFVTEEGAIGINCGGMVYVKPLRGWHELADAEPLPATKSAVEALKKLTNSDDWNNAIEWNGDINGMRRRLTWLVEMAEEHAAQLDALRSKPSETVAIPTDILETAQHWSDFAKAEKGECSPMDLFKLANWIVRKAAPVSAIAMPEQLRMHPEVVERVLKLADKKYQDFSADDIQMLMGFCVLHATDTYLRDARPA